MPIVGDPIDLNLQLHDGATDKFPQVTLRDEDGVELVGSPVDLVHVGQGLYQSDAILMPDTREVTGVFITFNNAIHTILSIIHQRDLEIFTPSSAAEIIAILESMSGSGFTESTDSLEKIRELLDIITVISVFPVKSKRFPVSLSLNLNWNFRSAPLKSVNIFTAI